MKKKNKAVWGTRFNSATSKIFEKIGTSIDIDKRLFEEDIFASIVHAQMLMKQKIINKKRGNKIVTGLKKIRTERALIFFHTNARAEPYKPLRKHETQRHKTHRHKTDMNKTQSHQKCAQSNYKTLKQHTNARAEPDKP